MPARAGNGIKGENKQMTGPEVLDVSRDAIVTLLLVASPLMLVGLIVGVVISLFQALTQIQETTLVFVPKILAIFLALWSRCRSWPTPCTRTSCESPRTSSAVPETRAHAGPSA